jgi:hypothetical protein
MHRPAKRTSLKISGTSRPAKSLPQKYFVSPELFSDEQKKIFSRNWLLVGHQSQLKKSGDFFLATIAGESLIVVRDQKSEIRAFFNVCRHRGTRLKEEACGHASADSMSVSRLDLRARWSIDRCAAYGRGAGIR